MRRRPCVCLPAARTDSCARRAHRSHPPHPNLPEPENLLINPPAPGQTIGTLKLCDFGFARSLPKGAKEDLTDYVATRWYRAPELLLGATDYDKTVDQWAIACILAEMLTGQPLFPGESDIDQLYIIQKALGPLTPVQNELFFQNPRFAGLKFPDMTNPEGLPVRFRRDMALAMPVSFMESLLKIEPLQRISGKALLTHRYFEGLAAAATAAAPAPAAPPPSLMPAHSPAPEASTPASSEKDANGLVPTPPAMRGGAMAQPAARTRGAARREGGSSSLPPKPQGESAAAAASAAATADAATDLTRRRKRDASPTAEQVAHHSLRGGGRRGIEDLELAARQAELAANMPVGVQGGAAFPQHAAKHAPGGVPFRKTPKVQTPTAPNLRVGPNPGTRHNANALPFDQEDGAIGGGFGIPAFPTRPTSRSSGANVSSSTRKPSANTNAYSQQYLSGTGKPAMPTQGYPPEGPPRSREGTGTPQYGRRSGYQTPAPQHAALPAYLPQTGQPHQVPFEPPRNAASHAAPTWPGQPRESDKGFSKSAFYVPPIPSFEERSDGPSAVRHGRRAQGDGYGM